MLKKYSLRAVTKRNILSSAKHPGVYIYWLKKSHALYVGKAKNLKNRLYSYMNVSLIGKTKQLMSEAKYFSSIKVNSEIEALLLEARLVKNLKPKYNIQLKDDKHPLYIKVTKDIFPMVKTVRKIDLKTDFKNVYGPFPSSKNVKFVLKLIRKVIPYSDHLPTKKVCIYYQIGLCNPCPSEIFLEKNITKKNQLIKKYKDNIKFIKKILSGKANKLSATLVRHMMAASNKRNYEKAAYYKQVLDKLSYISQPIENIDSFIANPNLLEDIRSLEVQSLKEVLEKYLQVNELNRIECFDVSHLMGQNPTASMVTFINGVEEKNFYRKFRIKQKRGDSDTDSMLEVARRRLNHITDWGLPDLIIVDGGKSQVKIFSSIFKNHKVPIIGLAKRFETLVLYDSVSRNYPEIQVQGKALKLVQKLRDEAHRFARVYHHNLVTKTLLGIKR